MGISLLMDIGNSALNAQRIALDVAGENISNVNTPGYSRETASLQTQTPVSVNGLSTGTGVQVTAVQRSYDSFLQNQLVAANAVSGGTSTTNTTMSTIQSLFNDVSSSGTDGLSGSLQSFFSAWQDLASNPQGVAERQAVISQGQQLVDGFHTISSGLTSVQDNMNQNLQQISADANNQLKQIASLNVQIQAAQVQGTQANELEDQRDNLVQQLSLNVGVTAKEESDGTMTVTLGSGDSGTTLVSGDTAGSFTLQANSGNSGFYDVVANTTDGKPVNVTSQLAASSAPGALGATLTMRDATVPGYLKGLNELAGTLVQQVNATQTGGYGLDSSTGVNFFTPTTTAADMSVAITSTDQIAAASTDPSTGGTGNNINAQAVAALADANFTMTGGNMTLGDFYTSLMGTVGTDVQSATQNDDQATSTVNQLNNLWTSQSGVSLDEELTNLTSQQRAYQGAAKLITVGTEMLDTILGMVQS